jgi:DNA-binding SARP family transcriptional activator
VGTPRRKTLPQLFAIRFFRSVSFTLGEKAWRFTAPPRTLPLLAYLVLHRDKPVPRDAAAFALWPDEDETDARANLRRHLHYLNAALPTPKHDPPWVLIHGRSTLQWNPKAQCSIDIADFERLSAGETTLDAADQLYAGDLLPDINDDWILGERERLRGKALTNLTKLIGSARRDGDLHAALRYAQRLLSIDPWREDATRQAMELRYALGDRAGALAEFEDFSQRLRRQLDAEPMPETIACYESLVRDAPVLQTLGQAAPVKNGSPRLALPFVGREAELAQLHVWWTRAARGSGMLGFVAAEAGLGKTRLLLELKNLVESEGGRVLLGATASLENQPYQAILEALAGAASILEALRIDPLWLAVLSELSPDLTARYPDLKPPEISADQVRSRLFEAFFQVLQALSAQRPTLLIVEDIHWAGEATMDLLRQLSRRVSDARLLIVASYREEEVSRTHPLRQLRKRGVAGRAVARIALSPIAPGDVETLVTKLSRRLPPDAQWPQLLYTRSEGNPLFLTQLIATALEQGTATPLHEPLPGGVADLIRLRIARLSADAHALALLAAIIGDAFDADLLQEIAAWNARRVSDALDELLDRRMIRDTGLAAAGDYAFAHHLIEAAAYQEASSQNLTRRHERVAIALQELYADRQDELCFRVARHFERGAQPGRAADSYARAARFALTRFAYEDAAARAAAGLKLAASDEQRQTLLLIREEAYARGGDASRREADLDALFALADPNDTLTRCELARRRVNLLHSADRRTEEGAAIQELTELAERSGSSQAAFEACYARARLSMLLSRSEEAVAHCERALGLAANICDDRAQTRCYCLLADMFDRRADFPSAHAALIKADEQSSRSGDLGGQLAVLLMSCRLANWQNHYDDLQRYAMRMLDLSTSCGDRAHEGTAANALGVAALYRFAVADARRYFSQAVEVFEALNRPRNVVAARLNQILLLTRLGCLDDAIALGERTREMAITAHARLFGEAADCAVAEAYLRNGDIPQARKLASAALQRSSVSGSRNKAPASLKLARCDAAEGDFEAALARIEETLPLLKLPGLEIQHGDALADRCWTAMHLRRVELAKVSARGFLSALCENPERFSEPEALFTIAALALQAAGEDVEARAHLETAWTIYQRRLAAVERPERRRYAALWFHRDLEQARAAAMSDR